VLICAWHFVCRAHVSILPSGFISCCRLTAVCFRSRSAVRCTTASPRSNCSLFGKFHQPISLWKLGGAKYRKTLQFSKQRQMEFLAWNTMTPDDSPHRLSSISHSFSACPCLTGHSGRTVIVFRVTLALKTVCFRVCLECFPVLFLVRFGQGRTFSCRRRHA
jgi:hypothetical protein